VAVVDLLVCLLDVAGPLWLLHEGKSKLTVKPDAGNSGLELQQCCASEVEQLVCSSVCQFGI
jgi:hypothetical protein